jgi:hypothetical protein
MPSVPSMRVSAGARTWSLIFPAVDGGEEVAADHGQHHAAEREHQRGDHRDDEPPLEQHREHADVAAAEALEAAVEAGVKPREPAVRALAVALALEQEADDNRR